MSCNDSRGDTQLLQAFHRRDVRRAPRTTAPSAASRAAASSASSPSALRERLPLLGRLEGDGDPAVVALRRVHALVKDARIGISPARCGRAPGAKASRICCTHSSYIDASMWQPRPLRDARCSSAAMTAAAIAKGSDRRRHRARRSESRDCDPASRSATCGRSARRRCRRRPSSSRAARSGRRRCPRP